MTPEAIIEDRRFQETLDKIRKEEGYDFAAIAFYESNKPSSPIKWHYVSGNKNNRFKLIILRKGRGLAGTVMKTGKRMVIANVGLALGPEEKIDYPILLSESLTAVLAVPLWYKCSDTPTASIHDFGINNPTTCPKNTGIIPK